MIYYLTNSLSTIEVNKEGKARPTSKALSSAKHVDYNTTDRHRLVHDTIVPLYQDLYDIEFKKVSMVVRVDETALQFEDYFDRALLDKLHVIKL